MNFNPDQVPATVDEAIEQLFAALSPEEKTQIAALDSSAVHMTLGMYLRNNWSLWDRTTKLSLDFQKRFKLYCHGDDLSGIILTGLWASVQGRNVAHVLEQEAEKYRLHWIRHGLDPATGARTAPLPPTEPTPYAPLGERISILLDDGSGQNFDTALRAPGTLQDHGDLRLIEKANGTTGGRPIVLINFTVRLPDGRDVPAQTVTTLRALAGAVGMLKAKHNL